ncbi:MAG: hypothetical protein HFJ80_07975 [Clostridiales bacterium]|nr:hypothetical protein [Clostridiales bacterium]
MDNPQTPRRARQLALQIRYDCSSGILHVWYKLLPVPVVFLLAAALFYQQADHFLRLWEIGGRVSLADLVILLFQGMPPFDPSTGDRFEIPATWLFVNLYTAFLIGGYTQNDLHGCGQMLLLRSKRRGQWWLGKCVWAAALVLSVYLLAYGGVLLAGLAAGALSPAPTPALHVQMSSIGEEVFEGGRWVFLVMVMPFLTSLALSLLQMTLSFFLKPSFSFIGIASLLVVSAFFLSPACPGNYSMLLRSEAVLAGGIPLWWGAAADLLMIAASAAVGYRYFRHCDILHK